MPTLTDELSPDDGAIVRIRIGLTQEDIRRRRRLREIIPQPVECLAMIDTGSDLSSISPHVIAGLKLPVKGGRLINSPGLHGLAPAIDSEIRLELLHPTSDPHWKWEIPTLDIIELDLGVTAYEALIGRNLLANLSFAYDGPQQKFHLTY